MYTFINIHQKYYTLCFTANEINCQLKPKYFIIYLSKYLDKNDVVFYLYLDNLF